MRSSDSHLFPYYFCESSLVRFSSLVQKGKLLTDKTKLYVIKCLYFFKNLNFITHCFHLTNIVTKILSYCLVIHRTHFSKCKSILNSSDEEDEVAQGSAFTQKTNKRSIAPTDELFSSQEQDSSMPESDIGGDEPLLSKRAKTTHQTDILKC